MAYSPTDTQSIMIMCPECGVYFDRLPTHDICPNCSYIYIDDEIKEEGDIKNGKKNKSKK